MIRNIYSKEIMVSLFDALAIYSLTLIVFFGMIALLLDRNNEISKILSDHDQRIQNNRNDFYDLEERVSDHAIRFTLLSDSERDLEVRNLTAKQIFLKSKNGSNLLKGNE